MPREFSPWYRTGVADWRLVVEIDLESETLRFAEHDLILDDHTVYHGRLIAVPSIRSSLGRIVDPQLIQPEVRLVLNNLDDYFTDKVDEAEFANRPVRCRMGNGTDASTYTTLFAGHSRIFDAWEWDEAVFILNVASSLGAKNRTLPPRVFTSEDYPDADEAIYGRSIPIVYGDWTTDTDGLPAYQIDSTEGTGGRFKIADHEIDALSGVFLNGVAAAYSDVNLVAAEFVLGETFDSDVDQVTVTLRGSVFFGAGGYFDQVPLILLHLLYVWLEIEVGELNEFSFYDWNDFMPDYYHGRRWIGTPTPADQLITGLLVDGFADLLFIDGQYKPQYRIVYGGTPITLHEGDLPRFQEGGSRDTVGGLREVRVTRDPEGVYCNSITGVGALHPTTGEYQRAYRSADEGLATTLGAAVHRQLTLTWLWMDEAIVDRTMRELHIFSDPPEMVTLRTGPTAMRLHPGAQFRLTYGKWASVPFQVRDQVIRFDPFSVQLTAWNMTRLLITNLWTADDDTATWLSSTEEERDELGFWTDEDGYADTTDPPDSDSRKSIWM